MGKAHPTFNYADLLSSLSPYLVAFKKIMLYKQVRSWALAQIISGLKPNYKPDASE